MRTLLLHNDALHGLKVIRLEELEERQHRNRVASLMVCPDNATEVIEQFKALPATERAQVAKFVVENDDSWIPESFRQGMADAEAGRFVDLDIALNEPYAMQIA